MDEQRLVVRLHDPRRFRLVLLAGLLLTLLLGVGVFELGQRSAGHSILKSDQQRRALKTEVSRLRAESQQLKDELARVQTRAEVDREAQALLQDTLAASENQVAELDQELQFYRRIVVPPDGQQGLRVQDFEIFSGSLHSSYRLRLLLVQNPQRSGRAEGRVELLLHGKLNGEDSSLSLEQLASAPQEFEFLYFQDVELEVILPEGFEPDSAEVELYTKNRESRAAAASFPWKPRA